MEDRACDVLGDDKRRRSVLLFHLTDSESAGVKTAFALLYRLSHLESWEGNRGRNS